MPKPFASVWAGKSPAKDLAAELGRWLTVALMASLVSASSFVAWRRLAGGLTTPLEPLGLIAIGALLLLLAAAARIAWRRLSQPGKLASRHLPMMILVSASLLVVGLALSPGSRLGGLVVFWSLLVGGECWSWRRGQRTGARGQGTEGRGQRAEDGEEGRGGKGERGEGHVRPDISPPAEDDHFVVPRGDGSALAQNVLQQLTLSQTANGAQRLSGRLRMPVAAGQRTGSIHVAFCPPFAAVPELTIEQIEGPACRVKTAQLLPYGVRLDLRLVAIAETPGSVVLQFAAHDQCLGSPCAAIGPSLKSG